MHNLFCTSQDEIPQKIGTAFKQLDAMQRKTEVVYPSLEACIVRSVCSYVLY